MNLQQRSDELVVELRQERERIDQAITVLEALNQAATDSGLAISLRATPNRLDASFTHAPRKTNQGKRKCPHCHSLKPGQGFNMHIMYCHDNPARAINLRKKQKAIARAAHA